MNNPVPRPSLLMDPGLAPSEPHLASLPTMYVIYEAPQILYLGRGNRPTDRDRRHSPKAAQKEEKTDKRPFHSGLTFPEARGEAHPIDPRHLGTLQLRKMPPPFSKRSASSP